MRVRGRLALLVAIVMVVAGACGSAPPVGRDVSYENGDLEPRTIYNMLVVAGIASTVSTPALLIGDGVTIEGVEIDHISGDVAIGEPYVVMSSTANVAVDGGVFPPDEVTSYQPVGSGFFVGPGDIASPNPEYVWVIFPATLTTGERERLAGVRVTYTTADGKTQVGDDHIGVTFCAAESCSALDWTDFG